MSERRPQNERELVELLHGIDVPAPPALHRQVEAMVADRSRTADRPRRRTGGPLLALAGAGAVALVVALVLSLAGGSSLTVRETSALTLRAATMAPPREDPRAPRRLTVAVDGIPFPYWGERLGWRTSGARVDRLDGRTVTTVFYEDAAGRRVGYAIVGGTPAPPARGGRVAWRAGVRYRLSVEHGANVVAWQRAGHLCVVSGRAVDSATLLRLASADEGVSRA
jgi:hypothetical protein